MTDRPENVLTALDESFLHMEHEGLPMHVASVATFEAGPLLDDDGNLRLDDIRTHIAARAHLLPRLRQRVWTPPGDIDHARWVDDDDFDIARHIDAVAAPGPGDDDALRTLAAETETELLDRAHPLWHIRIVTGLTDDRIGLIQRTHHAMVDGVSGVDVAAVILDLEQDPGPDELDDWTPEPPPDALETITKLVRDSTTAALGIGAAVQDALRHPLSTLRRGRELVEIVREVLTGGSDPAPSSSLNIPVSDRRQLTWVRTELDTVKAAGREEGATANDVILTAVAGGLRHLLLHRGEPVASDLALKVLVPVSIRTDAEHGALGNRVGAIVLPLPVGIGDPTDRLRQIVATMRTLKEQDDPATVDLLWNVVDRIPTRVTAAIARSVLNQHTVNLVVTNVPGPRIPLYLLGSKMLEVFPVVPLGGNLTLGVAILSYLDAMNIGITTDPVTCADVDVFVEGIEHTLKAMGAR